MKKLIIPLLAIPLTFLIANIKADIQNDTSHPFHNSVVSLSVPSESVSALEPAHGDVKDQPNNVPSEQIEAQQTAPKQASEPPKPVRWTVSSTPLPAATVENVNTALAIYQDMGMSKQGAAYLIGNFMGESHLIPCGNYGDGGQAHGLGQWHPGRRHDMPCDYQEQLRWAVDVEMQRDSPATRAVLFDQGASIYQIQSGIQNWERWGTLGARWVYAANVYAQLQ